MVDVGFPDLYTSYDKFYCAVSFCLITGLIISHWKRICIMPEPVQKKKACNPDAYLDEEDLKDIAESEEDFRQGRFYTNEEFRIRHGLR